MTRELHIRCDRDELADLRLVTRCPEAAIVRAGLAKLTAMIRGGELADLRILVAEHVRPTGPKAGAPA